MRLSKRSEYGIRAMLKLANRSQNELVNLKEIADEENIPIKFLEQIFLSLKNTGLLHSKSGRGGGYYLGKPANQIHVGQIVRILDGPLAPINCVSETAYESCDCPDEDKCGLRLAMLNVRNAIAGILDNTTLADIQNQLDK